MRAAFLAAAALLVASVASAEQPLAVYPGTVHTRIGNDLVVGGEHYRIAYFTTSDPIEKVANYFYKQFQEQGYPAFIDGSAENDEWVVSAFYTREGLMRSIVLRGHEGKTLGFTVLKDLWTRENDSDAANADSALVPLEGTLMSENLAHDDGQGRARQRTQIVQGTLTSVRNDLFKRMTAQGFSLANETGSTIEGKKNVVLEFSRPGEQVVSSMTQTDDKLVGVYQTWIGSDRPDAVPNDRAVQQLRDQIKREKAKGQP